MKKFYALSVLFAFLGYFAVSQNSGKLSQRTTTNYEKGKIVEFSSQAVPVSNPSKTITSGKSASINWQASDTYAVGQYVKISGQNDLSVCAWGLNAQRLSAYGNSNVPIWESPCKIFAWDEVTDMTDDGNYVACGYDSTIQVFNASSNNPIWEVSINSCVKGIQISNDGKVFVASFNSATQNDSYVYCYQVGQDTPLWTKSYTGNATALAASKSGNRVVFCEYGGTTNKLWILDGANGDQLFETGYADQNPPSISYDGKYVVSGNYSGYAFLYEYNEANNSYFEKWNYKVNGSNSWITGMSVSADGSTVAVGSLIFLTNDYDGELYVFNTYSPVPLWIATGFKDEVNAIDMSSDGSIIAAGSWGPIDNSKPDIFLYRKQSSTPYFSVNTPGSVYGIDLSTDGKSCIAGGKAVHARQMGWGGTLYNINSDLGGGILAGNAVKSGSTNQAGVKVEIIGLNQYFTYTNDTSHYSLPYIPAGTYTVKYSAVGYVPQEIPGIVIAEGQITNKNVTMISTGMPPTNLVGTQGADTKVHLTWQAPASGNITGYQVFRKMYAPDFYPETPIATLSPSQLSFIDTTALPLKHYFYAVSAVLSGNLQSPYSNDAEGWLATGFIANQLSAYVGTAPVIDGVINQSEWADAYKVDISDFMGTNDNTPNPIGSVTAYFKVNADKTKLYCAVDDKNDVVLEDHDEVALYIDDNNDGTYPPSGDDSEGNFWAAHYASGDVIKYRPLYNTGGVGTVVYLSNPEISVSNASGHVVYEFVIPMGSDENWKIDFNEQNQSRIFAFVLDDPSSYDGYWPCTNMNVFNPAGYGVITFGDIDQTPPAPDGLALNNQAPSLDIVLSWNQPEINDFNHFNIYWSNNNGQSYNLLGSTIGVQYFYTLPASGTYMFYVTTVDNTNHESVPSQTVTFGGGGTTFSLSGTITYPNTASTPLSGITLNLKNSSGTVIATATSNASGSYSFANLANGTYTLEPSTTKTWGGVSAADVLLYKKHIANVSFLTGIFLASGDVNASNSLTAADVLLIKKRIAYVINSFTVGDWLFNNTSVTINGGNATQNFNGLCFGDANGSYAPPAKGYVAAEPQKIASGDLTILSVDSQNGKITVPVYATNVQNLGSFQFTISYDASKLTFTGADNWFAGISDVTIGNPVAGKLTFVWATDANAISLSNDKLFDLHFNALNADASSISWSDVPTAREFADYDGNIYDPSFVNGAVGAITGIGSLSNSQLMIYPNPAKDFVNIKYADEILSVKVINYTGQVAMEQKVNATDVKINTSDLKSGIYFIQIETKNGKISKSIAVEK